MDESEWGRKQAVQSEAETRMFHGPNATLPHRDWVRIDEVVESTNVDAALNDGAFRRKVISLGALCAVTNPKLHSWKSYRELLDEVVEYVRKAKAETVSE